MPITYPEAIARRGIGPTGRVSSRVPPAARISQLVDAALEAAPDCLREGVILQSIDWSAVAPAKVATMLSSLQTARVACPRWLATALLVAGHGLATDTVRHLPSHLKVLQRVNCANGDARERQDIAPLLDTLADDDGVDGDCLAAIVRQLARLGWSEEAVRLALTHAHRVPVALRHIRQHLPTHLERLPVIRLRLAGFSTTQTLADELRLACAAEGWRADVSQADFGEAIAELMSPRDDRDGLLVLLDIDGFAPRDWRNSTVDGFNLLAERAELLGGALAAFAERSGVPLLINTIPSASAPTAGLLDRRHEMGLRRGIDLINARVLGAADQSGRIAVIDADQALAELPLSRHVEPKLWFYGRIAYSADATRALARNFAQAWGLLRRGPVKVVAVDLDNTLWGGVYGDDGVEKLACGHDFPGNAFLAMQQECLRLKSQGLLLVALSKNNADAATAFERHPGMAMKADDFAAMAVNWDPKPQNIRRVAADLNLGLDSFVFLDDSPQERDAMRRLCPDVAVPEMPSDPADRPLWLRRLTCTWPVRLTAEDETRAALYATGRKASRLKASAATLEDFLRGLEQRLIVGYARKDTVARVAQMHQRTNQFNLTTLRSTDADIAAMARDDSSGIALLGRVSDKFGDHGIVIAATVAIEGDEAVIRSLLMSCRVIGRQVEHAFLGELLRELARRGVKRVRGDYIPTAKNGIVREFYASCGFELVEADERKSTWSFSFDSAELPSSRFVVTSWEA